MSERRYCFLPFAGTREYRAGAGEVVTYVATAGAPLADHWTVRFPDGTVCDVATRDLLVPS